jgi:hypothetical protein
MRREFHQTISPIDDSVCAEFEFASPAEIDAALDAESAIRARQAAPTDQLWLGLERYWRKRAQSAT